jgi:hypothetical protein
MTNLILEDARMAAVGTAAGLVATTTMSGLMVAARKSGLMSELPPHEITSKVVDRARTADDVDDDVDDDERRQLGWVAHFAFGAVAGALYGVLRQHVRTPGPATLHGAGYALAIWAVSYAGWIPALRFLPPAGDDHEPGRQPAMIAAHLAFGSVLGAIVDRALPERRSLPIP